MTKTDKKFPKKRTLPFERWCEALFACGPGLDWAEKGKFGLNYERAWSKIPRTDWLAWFIDQLRLPKRDRRRVSRFVIDRLQKRGKKSYQDFRHYEEVKSLYSSTSADPYNDMFDGLMADMMAPGGICKLFKPQEIRNLLTGKYRLNPDTKEDIKFYIEDPF